jgi:tetratricopeptide (TPR) repeat protein
MFRRFHSTRKIVYALSLVALLLCFQPALAQSDDETDPVKLFEKGQDAHAKNDLKHAIELYDAAIKLRPEFPEAEFQRAMALVATNRNAEAVAGFNRAVALRPDWTFAYAKFGVALSRNTNVDVVPILKKAVELDDKNLEATVAFAFALDRTGAHDEALKVIRAATSLKDATAETWLRRYFIEVQSDHDGALASITHALELEPANPLMHAERARVLLLKNDVTGATADLDAARAALTPKTPNTQLAAIFAIAQLYGRVGKPDEGLSLIDALDERTRSERTFVELRADLAADAGKTTPEDLAALEKVLQLQPNNANLLSRLGNAYRRTDPAKSQDYYRRANQIDPQNPRYAVGYAAALIQARKFAEAEPILKRVIALTPDDYTAHANLALALYEMKRFAEALPEYEWLANAKPEIAATYFFIATAHDNLGEYKPALDAYEKFLSHADTAKNKLEIDKVNLRLPALRAQIQRGEGAKRKRP